MFISFGWSVIEFDLRRREEEGEDDLDDDLEEADEDLEDFRDLLDFAKAASAALKLDFLSSGSFLMFNFAGFEVEARLISLFCNGAVLRLTGLSSSRLFRRGIPSGVEDLDRLLRDLEDFELPEEERRRRLRLGLRLLLRLDEDLEEDLEDPEE